jgi:flagellin
MTKIASNIISLSSQNAVKNTQRSITDTMLRLSTGLRINRPSDDPAGLAVSTKFTSQINGYNAASRNINDAITMLQTADGALAEISSLMDRMRELAVQSSSDTYTSSDRSDMDTEYQQLESEITRIVSQTKWNKMTILDGANSSWTIQVGADAGQSKTITIANQAISGGNLSDLNGLDVTSQSNASNAITSIDNAFTDLNTIRANIGAYISGFEGALDLSLSMSQNLTDSRSRILDTDYAKEIAELAKLQIIEQVGNAMIAQANASPQSVLQLLQR